MGDPKKKKKKYMTPIHPWQKDRIDEEKELKKRYGLKNKREIWKAQSVLRNVRRQARTLLGLSNPQVERETKDLLLRLQRLSILKEEADLDAVLALTIEDILDRRLQSIAVRKGLATTPGQARQMIVHGHIAVNGKKVNAPSYFVSGEEEETISYTTASPFISRQVKEKPEASVPENEKFKKKTEKETEETAHAKDNTTEEVKENGE
ncbi:MAG: 30S ribosomal protein S4 [Candidatus Methanofastidiosia archaeon]